MFVFHFVQMIFLTNEGQVIRKKHIKIKPVSLPPHTQHMI